MGEDEGVACGVVAVVVGVDEGEFWLVGGGDGFGIFEEGAGEVWELGVDEGDGRFGGVDEGVAAGVEVC